MNKPKTLDPFDCCEEYYHQSWVLRFAIFITDYYNTRERTKTIKGEHKSN